MDLPIDPLAVKAGFDAVKSAIETLKSLRELYRSKPDVRAEIDEKIKLAEREVALGEAQIAQALGYKLCRAHFPPVPMLKNRVHATYVEEISKCPQCAAEDPSPEHFTLKERMDRSVAEYNSNLTGESWLSR
jgi:hypothetical protein